MIAGLGRRGLLFAAMAAWGCALPARAQAKHWLIGAWEGSRKNVGTRSRTGGERSLVVNSVAADGSTGKGQWIVSTGTVSVTLAIAGNVVTFTTPGAQGLVYRLVHKDGVLEGTWSSQSRGNGGAIELEKQ